MAEDKDRWLTILEATKTAVGIIAVVVGGYWTYSKFIYTEAPLHETNAEVTRELTAPVERPGGCSRSFIVGLKNTGKPVLTVRKVETRVWKFHMPTEKDAFADLVDLDKITAGSKPVFEKRFPDPAFAGEARWYPFLGKRRPNESYTHEFQFFFRKEPEAWIYVLVEIFLEGEENPKIAGVWSPVCS